MIDYVSELSDVGENEDTDVKTERQKVKNLMSSNTQNFPVVMVQVIPPKI